MYAVIRTGGKQYRVSPDQIVIIEKIPGAAGERVEFPEVLMIGGETPQIGAPLISGALVTGEVVRQGRGEKIIVFKKKRRKNYRRKKGHQQDLTTVRIVDILTDGKSAPKKAKKTVKPKAAKSKAKKETAKEKPEKSEKT